ncbi:hypothetical protein MKEN_00490900 [Mycena kentingensis (nom. inval.)]|nr:hypothetical protein MKEN_00490900 [Mycena kentingensis (nom. inval.)]
MHASLLLAIATATTVRAALNITIPGLTDGQKDCVSSCIFDNIGRASTCNPTSDDGTCFCASSAYVGTVEYCSATQCSVCVDGAPGSAAAPGGKCNVTGNPLESQCGSSAVSVAATFSPASISDAPQQTGSFGNAGPAGGAGVALVPRGFAQTASAVGVGLVLVLVATVV